MSVKKTVAIIGGGPAAMMLAAQLDEKKYSVTIYEKNAALGRKFLVAGDGGFNLTHSEHLDSFISRYIPASFFKPIIHAFSNNHLRHWLKNIGIETYTGTSGRVFPVNGIKPIEVLSAIINELKKKQVTVKTHYEWKGIDNNVLYFQCHNETKIVSSDFIVFAMGGASWKVTGSDGHWTNYFQNKGIILSPFTASNCACHINWPDQFLAIAEGKALKNIALKCGEKEKKGEVVITRFGLEGGAVYALVPEIRKQLSAGGTASLTIDLKPHLSIEEVHQHLVAGKGRRSQSKFLESELRMNKTHLALLKECTDKETFTNISLLTEKIKNLPISVTGLAPIDEAISTAGGIPLNDIDEHFQLKHMPSCYAIGEMLDWDAPTGGYLLQGCFSMGYVLATHLNSDFQ